MCALFYADPDDPIAGGTRHTIRMCRMEVVPCVFQDGWRKWIRTRLTADVVTGKIDVREALGAIHEFPLRGDDDDLTVDDEHPNEEIDDDGGRRGIVTFNGQMW